MHILLADDDKDDCQFFEEALEELPLSTRFATVHDGEKLIQFLLKTAPDLPDVLFLDLNIPRKRGIECLSKIKSDKRLMSLPVIIFSTSLEKNIVNRLYNDGALLYIRKPARFSELKQVIHQALTILVEGREKQPLLENFVLTGD